MNHEHSGHSSKGIVDISAVITKLVGKDDIFLDVGCGTGDYLAEALKRTKNVIGIDLDGPSIEAVKSRGIRGIKADATKEIPLEKGSVDSVLMANVLHGFVANGEFDGAMAEVARVLKNGGLLGIVEFDKNSEIGPPMEIKLSPAEVAALISSKGYARVSEKGVGHHHYLVIFKKV